MKISVPYYKSEQTAEIPDNELIAVLRAKGAVGSGEAPEALVRASLENPIGSPRLCELAKSVDDALVICSDHTRPVPSKILMPLMLEEIRRFNPKIKVTLLIATGCDARGADL
jgi:nickel-dependent lactate racemase